MGPHVKKKKVRNILGSLQNAEASGEAEHCHAIQGVGKAVGACAQRHHATPCFRRRGSPKGPCLHCLCCPQTETDVLLALCPAPQVGMPLARCPLLQSSEAGPGQVLRALRAEVTERFTFQKPWVSGRTEGGWESAVQCSRCHGNSSKVQ